MRNLLDRIVYLGRLLVELTYYGWKTRAILPALLVVAFLGLGVAVVLTEVTIPFIYTMF